MTQLSETELAELERLLEKATGGKWLAASAPSSIVGWPVVSSPTGRSVCSVSWLGVRPVDVTDEEWSAYQDEVAATAKLIPAAVNALPRLLSAIRPQKEPGEGETSEIPESGLISRKEVIELLRATADRMADMAIYGLEENARAREAMEAALTNAAHAIAFLPASGGPPADPTLREKIDEVRRANAGYRSAVRAAQDSGPYTRAAYNLKAERKRLEKLLWQNRDALLPLAGGGEQ